MFRKRFCIVLFSSFLFFSCKDEIVLPKPKAMLRLEYPNAVKGLLETEKYQFEYNSQSKIKSKTKGSVVLDYPMMKGAIYITYKKVENNLRKLIRDADKLSFEHAAMADHITPHPFVNKEEKVYGVFFQVEGNAASQAQFYVTDSVQHFVTGSLYFAAKPNYDSIQPAADYLQKDIRKIMESLQWKN
ncbi:MAG: gliding motility lipoprotein GldD [Cellulophaga sp.]